MTDLHPQLRELVQRAGRGVIDDAQHFQALLDDYVSEQAATRGEINLLVDTVRLGAARRLLEQIEHGAAPGPAIDVQAELLARDRATGEHASGAWSLAALGFALGVVDAAEVGRRHLAAVRAGALGAGTVGEATGQRTPTPGRDDWPTAPPPTAAPPVAAYPPTSPPRQPPPSAPTLGPMPGALPTQSPPRTARPAPPAGGQSAGWTGYPGPPLAPSSRPRRRTGRLVGLLVLVMTLIGGGVVAVIALSGEDDPRRPAEDESSEPVAAVLDPDRIHDDMSEILEGLTRSSTTEAEFKASSWSVEDDNIVDAQPRSLVGDEQVGATSWLERRESDERRYWIIVEHLGEDYVAERDPISCEERTSSSSYCAEHTTPSGRTADENVYSLDDGKYSYYIFVPGDGAGQQEITIGESVDAGVVPQSETGKEAIPFFELEIDAVLDALDDPRLDVPLPDERPPLPSYHVCAYIYPPPAGHDCPEGLT